MEENLANGLDHLSARWCYDGAERRLSRAAWLGPERRVPEPLTEQDHPEVFEPQEVEAP